MKKAWQKWLFISKKIARFQATILLFIVYYIIIIPLSFILKSSFKKSLLGHGYQKTSNSFWIKRQKIKYTLMWAKKQ